MNFNLEYYRAFFATANYLNFTKAADHLYLTQSAVSQSVKKLENELNCALFLRTPHGLKLTREGTILHAHVKKAFEELQTAEAHIARLADFQAGELRIGATETSLRFFLPPLIRQFREQFPNIHMIITGSTTADTCRKLSDGEIDAAFLISPIPPEYQFQLTKLRDIQDIFVVSREFPLDFDRVYSLRELADFPFISVASDNSVRTCIDELFLEHDVLFTPDYTVKSTGLVLPLVQNCLGIGILPYEFAAAGIKNGSLVRIKTADAPSPRSLHLAENPASPVSAIGREFIRFTVESAGLHDQKSS